VWESNGYLVYAYVRETVNAAVDGFGLISHHAPLTRAGFAATTVQYLGNAFLQRAAQQTMGLGTTPTFDIRLAAVSGVAELIDVGSIAAASRFGSPEQPISFLRGRFSEAEPDAYRTPTAPEFADRISQRACGRHLVPDVTKVIPAELANVLAGGAGEIVLMVGVVASSLTHGRELMCQAENGVRRKMRHDRSMNPTLARDSAQHINATVRVNEDPHVQGVGWRSTESRNMDDII
jgi:hypothetical protein